MTYGFKIININKYKQMEERIHELELENKRLAGILRLQLTNEKLNQNYKKVIDELTDIYII
jgi:hypothetical protein